MKLCPGTSCIGIVSIIPNLRHLPRGELKTVEGLRVPGSANSLQSYFTALSTADRERDKVRSSVWDLLTSSTVYQLQNLASVVIALLAQQRERTLIVFVFLLGILFQFEISSTTRLVKNTNSIGCTK